jgi:hypothetical protein
MFHEPYVVYQGFTMGRLPTVEALMELQTALCNYDKVYILIDDSCFAERVYNYLTIGRPGLEADEDETVLQRACFLSSASELLRSLPKKFSHPALIFIRDNFKSKVDHSIAPSLIKTQLQRWGLSHQRIIGVTKLDLEFKVDRASSAYQAALS